MSTHSRFFELRYVGKRFQGARLPLDVLSDLPAFRDLIVAYAKDTWRNKNVNRKRLPKGFDKSISFDLVAIEDGSAVPKLDWRRDIAQAALPEIVDELQYIVDESYQAVTNLIDNAGHERFPAALPSEYIRALNQLGSTLLADERIEFLGSSGEDGNVVYIDAYRRKALITRVQETYQVRYEGFGTLVGLHSDGYINVETERHGELRLEVDPARIDTEFNGNIRANVQFSILIELDNNDSFRSVKEIYDIEVVDSDLSYDIQRCKNRLLELKKLIPGWHENYGASVTVVAAAQADELIEKRAVYANLFSIFPTPSGGILFEFIFKEWDYSIEILHDGEIEMYGVEIEGPDEVGPQTFKSLDRDFIAFFDQVIGA